jgi:DNA uptake protein ComE-like DNA-binding protein
VAIGYAGVDSVSVSFWSTPLEPSPDDPGREAEESSGDVISRALEALNRISFEQLRDLGLSVTQAARLLARRDARGSLSSFDDLSDLAGFSREVLDQLRRRLSPG